MSNARSPSNSASGASKRSSPRTTRPSLAPALLLRRSKKGWPLARTSRESAGASSLRSHPDFWTRTRTSFSMMGDAQVSSGNLSPYQSATSRVSFVDQEEYTGDHTTKNTSTTDRDHPPLAHITLPQHHAQQNHRSTAAMQSFPPTASHQRPNGQMHKSVDSGTPAYWLVESCLFTRHAGGRDQTGGNHAGGNQSGGRYCPSLFNPSALSYEHTPCTTVGANSHASLAPHHHQDRTLCDKSQILAQGSMPSRLS